MPVREQTAPREVGFLEKLQRLLAEGDFTSTYKFAVLIALTEISAEQAPPPPDQTHPITTRQLAERVIRLYWPQVRPFTPHRGGQPHRLKQNQGKHPAKIIRWIHEFQEDALGGRIPPTHLDGLMRTRAEEYERLLRDVEWKLIEMPLPRLQEINREMDEFIYMIDWTKADVEPGGGRLGACHHLRFAGIWMGSVHRGAKIGSSAGAGIRFSLVDPR